MLEFTKMHGCGNDYIYVYGEVPCDIAELSRRLSDRHYGVGADGMIYISPSDKADFRMRIFNADGSEAMMCGNGIRCVGKYLYDRGLTDRTQLDIETLSGVRKLQLEVCGDKVARVTVDMGMVSVGEDMQIDTAEQVIRGVPVSVGNPHFVIFTDDITAVPVHSLGPLIEHSSAFPGGVNAEFVQITGDNMLRMRVWERGSGITMACGTGACASAAAAVAGGYCRGDAPVLVSLDGGELEIAVESETGRCLMTGDATEVFTGLID